MLDQSENTKLPLRRKLIFLIVVVVGIFVFATFILNQLEKKQVIDTTRPDDLIARPPVDLIEMRGDRIIFGTANTPIGSVSAKKAANTLRIVCVGGSFMMGFPYTQAGTENPGQASIPFWILQELSSRMPDKKVEVINLAGVAQNSSRVLYIIEKMEPLLPDLVIVATGNNEGNLAPTRFNDALHQWVLYRAMKKVLTRPAETAKRPLFMPQDPDVEKIEKKFQENIEKIVQVCQSRNTPLILATIPINLRYKDYIADTHPGGAMEPKDDEAILHGQKLMEQCRLEEAIDAFAKSSRPAFAMNYMGRCYQVLGDYERARELYKGAVQLNPLTRTRPSLNDFLRSFPKTKGLFVVDLEKRVEHFSIGGIVPEQFFLDYCHLPWWGNYMMASFLSEQIIERALPEAEKKGMRRASSLEDLIDKSNMQSLYDLPESLTQKNYTRVWLSGKGTFPPEPKPAGCQR